VFVWNREGYCVCLKQQVYGSFGRLLDVCVEFQYSRLD